MINYQIKENREVIQKMIVKGHALFGDYGTDIVCASVSTALIMTANAIEVLGLQDHIMVKLENGYFELAAMDDHQVVQGLLKNLKYTLNELEAQYKSYIKNQKEE